MEPVSLIPQVEPLPIPWMWFDLLLILTFTVHILFMNVVFGSAVIGLTRTLRGKGQLAYDVGQKLPPLLALTINLGVAPLLFLQVNYGHFDYVSSVLMGGWWLVVIPVLIVTYYCFYIYKFAYETLGTSIRNLLYCLSILGLLYVGFMFTTNTTLMLTPAVWTKYFEQTGNFLNLNDPTVFPRYAHFMVGAVAVGGLFVALLGEVRKTADHIETGLHWFIHGTFLNLLVGLWFLVSLPKEILFAFLGGSIPATGTLLAGLISTAMMLMAGFKKKPKQATVWAVMTVFFMVCSRHWLRTFFLAPWFRIEDSPVTHQYGSFYLFLGFLVVGGVLMGYMVNLYLKSRKGRA